MSSTIFVRFSINSRTSRFITGVLMMFSVYRHHARPVSRMFSLFFHFTFLYTIVLQFYHSSPFSPLPPTLSSGPPTASLRLEIFIFSTHCSVTHTRIIPFPNEIRLYVLCRRRRSRRSSLLAVVFTRRVNFARTKRAYIMRRKLS